MNGIFDDDTRLTYEQAQKLYGDDDNCSVFWGDIPPYFTKRDVFAHCANFGEVGFSFLPYFLQPFFVESMYCFFPPRLSTSP